MPRVSLMFCVHLPDSQPPFLLQGTTSSITDLLKQLAFKLAKALQLPKDHAVYEPAFLNVQNLQNVHIIYLFVHSISVVLKFRSTNHVSSATVKY